jgi:fatty acid desaturase
LIARAASRNSTEHGGPTQDRWLAHPEDLHCVFFHVMVLALYGVAFWMWLHPEAAGLTTGTERMAFGLGTALLLGWCSGIEVGVNFHNHAHRRIFTRPWMNRWFGRTWTVSAGWPAYFWQYSHVVVHHRHLLGERDWTLPKRGADGEWEGFFRYCLLHWPWRYVPHLWRELRQPVASASVARRARVELGFFLVLFSIPFLIDPVMGLLLWALPAWIANVLVVGPGMVAQHAGREAPGDDHTYRHSNTFASKLFNEWMFNIGYHAEHHTYPHVHWSELPKLHAEIAEDLVADGAHVVPFGYYRGGYLLSRAELGADACAAEWEQQHPAYLVDS